MSAERGRLGRDAGKAFAPFRNGNFALYFSGQVVSNTGTWFQNLAVSLVVLDATGSAQALSGVTIAQFAPVVILSIPAGRLADRVRPRTLLLITSALSVLIVTTLAVVITTSPQNLTAIYLLVACLGSVQVFDRIAAQAIIFEIVGPDLLSRAAALGTIATSAARSIGPGLAGLAFQSFGATTCLVINAASFVAVLVSIAAIRSRDLHPRPRGVRRDRTRLSLRTNRPLAILLAVNGVLSLLAASFMLTITSAVALDFGGGPVSVGAAHCLNAVGAVLGGLFAAMRPPSSARAIVPACVAYSIALGSNALAPTLGLFLILSPVLGLGTGYYQGILYSSAQSSVAPAQIGRAASLLTLTSFGIMPFGALLLGAVIEHASGRAALAIGAVAAAACAALAAVALARTARRDVTALRRR